MNLVDGESKSVTIKGVNPDTWFYRFQSAVRRFLGVDELPSVEMLKALNLAQQQRFQEVQATLNAILVKLEQKHFDHPPGFVPQNMDWDTVQAIALYDLEKENKNGF